ncbi:uncharacterized protein LOC135834471 isoform X2 [Planococcus citri]|uniref:uncharacterized protein LOC135834471 isoform X2 n=1 Tax=Planococcus citri TaxID=170843 RepID=UPI0031F78005
MCFLNLNRDFRTVRMITFIKAVSRTSICSCLFLLSLNIYVNALHTSNHSTLSRRENIISHCKISEFQCENLQCIHASFICDGIPDCADGSDESYENCQNTICNEKFFQCDYGGCIRQEYLCDGLKQCVDGSDESPQICNVTSDEIRRKRAANDYCTAPPQSPDKTITYLCNGKESQNCNIGGYVREFTVATIKCNPTYSPVEDTHFRSVCHDRSWIPQIDNCYRMCERLNPVNVDLQCYRRGVNIPCDVDALLAGTTIRPICKALHTYRDFVPTYHEITCQDDGKWDKTLFSCVPECGRPYTNPTALISGGVVEHFGDSPWHVAVYNQDRVLICGGTIINPYLVVSAAHCFHDQANKRKSAVNYEIVVSKFTRDYNVFDNKNQKAFKLRDIRYSNKGYIGINNYFAADIAILILQEKLDISPTVLPACVDWAGLRTNRYPPENTPAKVVGWGKNEHGKLSEKLMTVDLPFISRERCLNNVPDEFKAFITFDKFCAGSEDGPGVLQGDSGGGLLFRENNLYYLRGIVSLKQPTATAVAAFTDLADHIDWILTVRNEIEREMIKKDSTLPQRRPSHENACQNQADHICVKVQNCPSANNIIANNIAVVCGYDSTGAADSICCPQLDPIDILPPTSAPIPSTSNFPSIRPTAPQYNTPPSIATAPPYKPPATRPSRPPHNTPQYNTPQYNVPQYNTRPPAVTGSDNRRPNFPYPSGTATQTTVQPGEYPHTALIGYQSSRSESDIEWGCDGALISERFVISAAQCGNTPNWGEAKWVMLGVVDLFSPADEARHSVYKIERRYDSPYYKPPQFYHDVTIFLLNASVPITPFIRPACLFNSAHNPFNTKATVTGWITTVQQRGTALQKSTITVVDDEKCRTSYRSGTQRLEQGYDSNTMVCAGNSNEGDGLCASLAGSPLQIATGNETCPWILLGVKSFGVSCGVRENAQPDVFTKISYNLSWVQSLLSWTF